MPYVLDVIVDGVDILESPSTFQRDVFLEFALDCQADRFTIPLRPLAARVNCDFSVRLILHVSDYSKSFMFAAMATTDESGAKVLLARAKFPLKAFPVGSSKGFKFPLMCVSDNTRPIAQIHIIVCLSILVPYRSTPNPRALLKCVETNRGQYWSAPP
jgi:hypothetical protein